MPFPPAPAPYQMGWNEIQNRIQGRLRAIPGIANVYSYTKLVKANPDTQEYKTAYYDRSGYLNFWVMSRQTALPIQNSPEDARIQIRRQEVELSGYFGYDGKDEREASFNNLTDAIIFDLCQGDGTLNGACVAVQKPQPTSYGIATMKPGVSAYSCGWKFMTEEVLGPTSYASFYPESGYADPLSDPGPGPVSWGVGMGDRMASWLNQQIAGPDQLNLASPIHWSRTTDSQTSWPVGYPANPFLMCPRLRMRLLQEVTGIGDPTGGEDVGVTLTFSLYYQKRQPVTGSVDQLNYQRSLKQDLEIIANQFTREQLQPVYMEFNGFQLWSVIPVTTIHEEMRHEWDNPGTRVSVGEVQITVSGKITNY